MHNCARSGRVRSVVTGLAHECFGAHASNGWCCRVDVNKLSAQQDPADLCPSLSLREPAPFLSASQTELSNYFLSHTSSWRRRRVWQRTLGRSIRVWDTNANKWERNLLMIHDSLSSKNANPNLPHF